MLKMGKKEKKLKMRIIYYNRRYSLNKIKKKLKKNNNNKKIQFRAKFKMMLIFASRNP
jgi:hypothetical protein